MNSLKVGLNLVHAHPGVGGVWTYVANVVKAIAGHSAAVHYTAFVTETSKALVPADDRFHPVVIRLRSGNRAARVVWEQTLLPVLAHMHHIDCVHWFANTMALADPTPAVLTVHDLKSILEPETLSLAQRTYLNTFIPLSVRKAAGLFAVSDHTADSLIRTFPSARDKVSVIPSPMFMRMAPAGDAAAFRTRYSLPDNFWLYVSHYYPHKNHARLFEAYSRLVARSEGTGPLVLCGNRNGGDEQLQQLAARFGIERRTIWLPRLDQEEMPALYSAAFCMVFPSLFEGGGIPVMEAMACGCPVAASDIPASREFAGDSALFFDPLDVNSIARAMETLQADPALRALFRTRSASRLRRLDPELVASSVLAGYERAVSSRAARRAA